MANKGGIEHAVRHFRAYAGWDPSSTADKIRKMCDNMSEDRWSLLSVSWTQDSAAMLVFSRPVGQEKAR